MFDLKMKLVTNDGRNDGRTVEKRSISSRDIRVLKDRYLSERYVMDRLDRQCLPQGNYSLY
jgi:hypothetical protein